MTSQDTLKKRFAREDHEAVEKSIAALMQHRDGRKFLWWLLQVGEVGTQPFAGNALQTAFGCGKQEVGNRILGAITETSPDGYLTMMKENADERRTRDTELAGAEPARPDRGYT